MSGDLSLEAFIEAILFTSEIPVTPAILAKATGEKPAKVKAAITELQTNLGNRGIRLTEHAGSYWLTTAQAAAPAVEAYLQTATRADLSPAALETLAIIAYRQPVTRSQVEAIRGVGSDQVIRNLTARGLVTEVGRAEQVGRPSLYGTIASFLEQFGLSHHSQLPKFEELTRD